jgi:Flp pilus assembly protein TadG
VTALSTRSGERGAIAVFFALALALLLGFVALVVDLGNAWEQRRAAQAGADSAALAAAQDIASGSVSWSGVVTRVKTFTTKNFTETESAWAACRDANALAYQPDLATGDTCISADSSTNPTKVRVRIPTREIKTFFGGIIGSSILDVQASATATITPGTGPCVICVVGPRGKTLNLKGNGGIIVTGGNVVDNSSGTPAAVLEGSGGVSATSISIVGSTQGSAFSPAPVHLNTPVPDPLAGLPVPSVTTAPYDHVSSAGSGGTISPGIYRGMTLSNSLTLKPGLYIFTGPIDDSSGANINGSGVTLYFTCASSTAPYYKACATPPTPGGIDVNITQCTKNTSMGCLILHGNGSLNISAPTSGTYQGVSIFYDRNDNQTLEIGANGGINFTGTIYAKTGQLNLTASGTNNQFNSLVDVGNILMSGDGNIQYKFNANLNVPMPATWGLSG